MTKTQKQANAIRTLNRYFTSQEYIEVLIDFMMQGREEYVVKMLTQRGKSEDTISVILYALNQFV